jgi:hypothetical protein
MSDVFEGRAPLFGRIKILREVRALKEQGIIKPGMSKEEITDIIVAAMAEDPDTQVVGFDWQGLIDLIVKMLPLIMALFGL